LWALKKVYEDSDISFFEMMQNNFKNIMDIDDTTNKSYGEWYDGLKNKLSIDKIKGAN